VNVPRVQALLRELADALGEPEAAPVPPPAPKPPSRPRGRRLPRIAANDVERAAATRELRRRGLLEQP